MDLSKYKPVIYIIACDSGSQEVSPGDEPFGLLSAFFCAGASTVIETLWPIASAIGRVFSSRFYENVQVQMASGKRVVDLTEAFREATLYMKKQRPDPYAWAAFTLNGAGFA